MYFQRWLLGIAILLLSFCSYATDTKIRTTPLPGTVTLTFDDGPAPIYTQQILDILRKYNIKATFFVVGMNAKRHPELIKQILAEGHAVASHSQTHPMLTKLSDEALRREVVSPQIIVENIIGKKPVCLRPPFGMANHRVKEFIRSQGIIPVPMGFNSFDYERPGADKIASWILKNVHNGQVILLHDGFNKREQTVEALPVIIEGIKKKGLGFSAICYS